MQFKFAFDSNPRIERYKEIDHQFSTGVDVHNHTPLGRENCLHEHIDFCGHCNEFYCLSCTEQHYRLRKVFLERFLVSDHCQSMETLKDYLLDGGFIVETPAVSYTFRSAKITV